jgi:hypothetical protein
MGHIRGCHDVWWEVGGRLYLVLLEKKLSITDQTPSLRLFVGFSLPTELHMKVGKRVED